MYEPRIHRVECTLSASEYEIEHARTPLNVLDQLYATARHRVAEQREIRHLVPQGHVMVKVTVEQWCEEAEDDA